MGFILFYGLLLFIGWLPEEVSGGMKFLIFLVLFFSLRWLFNRYRQLEERRVEEENQLFCERQIKQIEERKKQEEERRSQLLKQAEERRRQLRRQEEERKRQLRQSAKYNELCEVSKALEFYSVPITLSLNSLNEFRMYNKTVVLDEAYSEIYAKYKYLSDNRLWDKFQAVAALPANASEYVRQKEEEIYQFVNKAVNTPVKVIWNYTTPAGKKHYEDSAYIRVKDLKEYKQHRDISQQHIDQEKYRRERERGKMTRSLRYKIMRRDDFRCQICGRTAKDGIKLEVDHKKPLAKGGRTEPSNLWTLCQDCNRGKGVQYDP